MLSRTETSQSWRYILWLTLLILVMMSTQTKPAQAVPDITAPNPPTGVFVDDGSSWRAVNHFRVWWHNPPEEVTPVVAAHYELCPAVPPGPCVPYRTAGEDISEIELSVPHSGAFSLRIWLEDGAGNVDPSIKSAQTILWFDDGIPPAASMDHQETWQGQDTPANPSYLIQIDADAEWPISGIKGYSIALDGTMPDDEVDVVAAQDYERFQATHAMEGLEEGVTVVGVRSISNAGVPSSVVRFSQMRLDRTPPGKSVV